MMIENARRIARAGLLAGALAIAPAAPGATQVARFTSESVTLGAGGYTLNFRVTWSCDDAPQVTTSAPGTIDLVDAGGSLVGQVTATIGGGSALIHVQGAGTVSNAGAWVDQLGAGGTPADGSLHGTWNVTGLSPGAYTLRFWYFQDAVAGFPVSTIRTQAADAGGGGPVGGASPAPPPAVTLAVPQSATAFQPVSFGAAASVAANGNPLASVVIDVSLDGGATWAPVAADSRPTSPSDTESVSYAFGQAGSATLRATATDTGGLQASSQKPLSVAKAAQAGISIAPAAATVSPGQAVAFSVSGGATGNYAWGGSASGSGQSQTVAFPSPGTYSVTAIDAGNSNYNASAAASATVTVQPALYTLSVSATAGGSVSGGGSYPPNALATAAAAADPGNAFAGWTGDASGAAQALSVLMNSNKSVMAHFVPLLSQTISFVPPGAVSTLSPAFALTVTSSSGLPVSLALDSGPATLSAYVVSPTGAPGQVTLTATQPGNAQYLPAQPVVISFAVGPPPPGMLLLDDSAATKRSDRATRTTSFISGAAH
jgi:plastocyanin